MAMNYVENLDLFGVPVKEIPSIKDSGAPTTSTEGAVGCFYMDTETGDVYKCVAVADDVYTWGNIGSSEAVLYEPQELTPEQQAQARENIGAASIDDIPVFTTTATKTGGMVTVNPVDNTSIEVVTDVGSYFNDFGVKTIRLHHTSSANLVDFVSMLGGVGPIEHELFDVAVHDNSTLTFKGTNNTGGYVNIIRIDFSTTASPYIFPAGTYTLGTGITISGLTSVAKWEGTGNKSGTFTIDKPFVICTVYIAVPHGEYDKTIELYMVSGATKPNDYRYAGTTYNATFTNTIADGTFNWNTGELKDADGNLVERINDAAEIIPFDGPNTFLCGTNKSVVTYKKLFDPSVLESGNGAVTEVFDPVVWGLPILYLNGSMSGIGAGNAVPLNYVYNGTTGTCTLKWQGSSSLAYSKKNYTIVFDNAFEAVEGWGEQTKYCLKANYIDHSHARNVVNAKLWGQIVATRSIVPNELADAPNYGAVDGFPVIIMINDDFHGLYTFNIPKDGWMMGMGSGTSEAIVCADKWVDATYFKAAATLDGDFDLEYISDENNATWVTTSLNNLINSCINSDGTDLDTTIAQYVDLQSAIDYYIFTVLIAGHDMTGKNYVLATFDGVKWYFSAYDMDSTYGINSSGNKFLSSDYNPTFDSFTVHRLMELIKTYKTDAIKARYAQLRNTVLSESNIAVAFGNFAGQIPTPVYMQDVKKWPTIPNTSTNNISQIRDYYRMRVTLADKWIEAL